MTLGNVLAILISLAAIYLAVAFVRTKFLKIDTKPFTQKMLG